MGIMHNSKSISHIAHMLLKWIENQLQQKDDSCELYFTLVKQWRFNDT